MKFSRLSCVLAFMGIMVSACTSTDDEIYGEDTPPAGALPSAEFTPNSLPNEPFINDAIRIVSTDEYAPFYAIELMSDGHYLITYSRPYYYAPAVRVSAKGNGNFTIRKSRKASGSRTRARYDEDSTLTLYNGDEYGTFTKIGDKQYRLGNQMLIDLKEVTGSDKSVAYINYNGMVSHVYVNVSEPMVNDATRSLCRTWDLNSFELWVYWNGKYVVHGKQTIRDGQVESYFKASFGIEEDEFLDDDSEMCYKVIFTSAGTYICFYLDGDVEVAQWKWIDKAQGTLHYEDSMQNEDYDPEWDGYVTVRFAGNQMRIYEDYSETEEDITARIVAVNTLTATNLR